MERINKSGEKINILILFAIIFTGFTLGIGTYTFIYARGGSYISDNPDACANCHIMNDHYESWLRSSHRAVAVCNDCHTPRDFIPKYINKASNGFWHSWGFTSGVFPDPIRIKPTNRKITQEACRMCHLDIAEAIDGNNFAQEKLSCIECHKNVGHQ